MDQELMDSDAYMPGMQRWTLCVHSLDGSTFLSEIMSWLLS